MKNIISILLVLFSFAARAANENLVSSVDSFDIEIAQNFRHAYAVKRNSKAVLYLFSKSMVIDYAQENKSDTVYFEEVRKIRKGFYGMPFLKVVYKFKKEPFIISFRDRTDYENFYIQLKTREVKRYNSSFWEYTYLFSIALIINIGIIF